MGQFTGDINCIPCAGIRSFFSKDILLLYVLHFLTNGQKQYIYWVISGQLHSSDEIVMDEYGCTNLGNHLKFHKYWMNNSCTLLKECLCWLGRRAVAYEVFDRLREAVIKKDHDLESATEWKRQMFTICTIFLNYFLKRKSSLRSPVSVLGPGSAADAFFSLSFILIRGIFT